MYRQIGGRWVRQFLFSVPNTGSFQCIRLMFTFTRLSGSGDNIKTPSGSSSVASYFPFVKLGSQINSPRGKRSILEQDKYRIYPWSQNSLRYPCWKERKHRYIDTQSHFLALCKLVSESKPYCEFPNSGEGSKSWSILPISSSASSTSYGMRLCLLARSALLHWILYLQFDSFCYPAERTPTSLTGYPARLSESQIRARGLNSLTCSSWTDLTLNKLMSRLLQGFLVALSSILF